MATRFARARSKSGSKSKDHTKKDIREGPEKETQFMKHYDTKKAGQGKHAEETASVELSPEKQRDQQKLPEVVRHH